MKVWEVQEQLERDSWTLSLSPRLSKASVSGWWLGSLDKNPIEDLSLTYPATRPNVSLDWLQPPKSLQRISGLTDDRWLRWRETPRSFIFQQKLTYCCFNGWQAKKKVLKHRWARNVKKWHIYCHQRLILLLLKKLGTLSFLLAKC